MSITHENNQTEMHREMADNKNNVRDRLTDCFRKRCPDITLQEIDELVEKIHSVYQSTVNGLYEDCIKQGNTNDT